MGKKVLELRNTVQWKLNQPWAPGFTNKDFKEGFDRALEWVLREIESVK